jgi:hypothetical protein
MACGSKVMLLPIDAEIVVIGGILNYATMTTMTTMNLPTANSHVR